MVAMTQPNPAALRADLERRGIIKPAQPSDGYDPHDDFDRSINACYQAIRERVAAGGPAWEAKKK